MPDKNLADQAEQMDSLLPPVVRYLFVYDTDDPAAELPVAQLRVCGLLSEGPRPISDIAKELETSVSAATQVADRLEAAKIVERTIGLKDRRVKNLQLTDYGESIMRLRREERMRKTNELLGKLTPEMRDKLIQVLRSLAAASHALEEHAHP